MEGHRVILNDGTVLENGNAGYAEGFLWLWITGLTIQQVAAIVFDSSKTSKIVYQYGDMEDNYNGFTDCVALNINYDGIVAACLKEGA